MTEAISKLPEWRALVDHGDKIKTGRLSSFALGDQDRLRNCSLSLDGLHLNFALNNVVPETIALLCKLASVREVALWRTKMLRGEKINDTEGRAALHVALRQSGDVPVMVDGQNVIPEIRAVQKRIAEFVNAVRAGVYKGATGKPIKHVVNIGIGGSDLGPRMAVRALAPFCEGPEAHFVANADAFELAQLFKKFDPAETLFLVISKTFTTQETLLNANTARAWVAGKLGDKAIARHFVAVSTSHETAKAFGILAEHVFPIWDWVGGRFSLWSAVGLSIQMAIGNDRFQQLLRGAEAMDQHFNQAPLASNMPVILALLGIWSRNFLGKAVHVVLPYSERLRDLPRYLQQMEMESNGKTIGRDGKPVDVVTTPALFGEPGTVGQHGFHQWLHQGSDVVSADFIGVVKDDLGYPEHHRVLLSNLVAQVGALAFGQSRADKPQDEYTGNRGSNIITLDQLDPRHLGMLLALYEHKVFVQSVIWGINPFDQPGVELGKRLAKTLGSGKAAANEVEAFLASLQKTIVK